MRSAGSTGITALSSYLRANSTPRKEFLRSSRVTVTVKISPALTDSGNSTAITAAGSLTSLMTGASG